MTAQLDISRVVLVTGATSGIGLATALHLQRAGHRVVASARSLEGEGAAKLREGGCAVVALDVADAASREAAFATIQRDHGPVGVLINNAGYSQSGALETLPLDEVRRQFETNVFGLLGMCQAALPAMRAQRWGKIINISSMGGRFTFPGGGAYHASKHAVEALSDALRFEVAGFGVDVIIIQPGIIKTGFAQAALAKMDAQPDEADPYGAFNLAVAKATHDAYEGGPLARLGGGPEAVARVIEAVIKARHPKARYPVTASARALLTQRALLSDAMWDRFLRTSFPSPGALT